MNAADRTFEDIRAGDTASFERTVTAEDIARFAELSGDRNPLHIDHAYAASTKFGQPIAHGALSASFISALIGMHLPGRRCLLLSQELRFLKPVFTGDTLTVSGTVSAKSEAARIITIDVSILKSGEAAVRGAVQVTTL